MIELSSGPSAKKTGFRLITGKAAYLTEPREVKTGRKKKITSQTCR